jgi:hypothetical protein
VEELAASLDRLRAANEARELDDEQLEAEAGWHKLDS